ncbi:MAG: hypothetical protein Q8Q12_16180 [bacterium]|nr:hypothetical protein [bacterium]
MGQARDFEILTINPRDPQATKIPAIVPLGLIERYHKYRSVDFENLRAAKYVLENAQRIFSVLREFGDEERWCYTGRPERWYVAENVTAPFPDNLVFAVYLDSRIRIYQSRAERVAEDDPMSPVNWQSRYGGLVWKSTS